MHHKGRGMVKGRRCKDTDGALSFFDKSSSVIRASPVGNALEEGGILEGNVGFTYSRNPLRYLHTGSRN
jgi:hypothetical protein